VSHLEVEVVKLQDLQLDKKNARKHSERNIDAIKESLRQFGQRKPIVISHDGTVIAGNGTVVAARDLGWVQVTATRIPKDWSPQQITAYAIADNRTAELASWDTDILIPALVDLDEAGILDWTGFTQDDLENWESLGLDEDKGTEEPQPSEGVDEQGQLLALADITVDEPQHEVNAYDIWTLQVSKDGPTHALIVCSVIKEWEMWTDYLQGEALFVPFPDPFITHTDVARNKPLVLVQPDTYLAGHLLDKHAAVFGEHTIVRLP